jgi:hypothetical protein
MRRVAPLAALPLLTGCAAPLVARDDEAGSFDRAHSTMTPAAVHRFGEFPLYWLGDRFEGWNLTLVTGPEPTTRVVTFIYGDCTPTGGDEPSCSPPIVIQVKPLCAQLDAAAHHGAWKKFRVRGAPLGGEPHRRILFTAAAQVRVFANRGADPQRPDRVFAALVSANQVGPRIGPGDPFPPAPLPVLAGEEACT